MALPHTSLLDFYDKQQQQCNSVALLPINANVVVRRHSSHYYPMLENENEKEQQQQHMYQHLSQQHNSMANTLENIENMKSIWSSITDLNASFNCNKAQNFKQLPQLSSTQQTPVTHLSHQKQQQLQQQASV